jgi:transposase-like protein
VSGKQTKAIAALLTADTIESAAETVGVSRSTLYRWLQDPTFRLAYQQTKRRLVEHAIAKSQRLASQAIAVLREVMVSAAKIIVEICFHGIEIAEAALFDAVLASTAPYDPRDARPVAEAERAFTQFLASDVDTALLHRIIARLRTPLPSYF